MGSATGRPKLRFTFIVRRPRDGERLVLPIRRSWPVVLLVAFFAIAMSAPAVSTFGEAARAWARLDSLFDLVTALFLSAWLLGWSTGVALLYAVLIAVLLGREILVVRPGTIALYIAVPGLAVGAEYDAARIRNLRLETPDKTEGTAWRGPHLAFDYGRGKPVSFGSAIGAARAAELTRLIEGAGGGPVPRGPVAEEAPEAARASAPGEAIAVQAEPAPAAPPATLTSPSTLALVIANLVPVAGAVWFGWNLGDVMVLYWAESGIIAFYNVLKMWVIERWKVLLAGPFFLGHFGGFMAVHFLFIYGLFVKGPQANGPSDSLYEVAAMFAELRWALAALFASHGISFVTNFLGRREYLGRQLRDQMGEPYSRVIAMHVALIAGGGLVLLLGDPAPVLMLLIAIKIAADVRAHLREHLKDRAAAPA
jgi:hypothetical protein